MFTAPNVEGRDAARDEACCDGRAIRTDAIAIHFNSARESFFSSAVASSGDATSVFADGGCFRVGSTYPRLCCIWVILYVYYMYVMDSFKPAAVDGSRARSTRRAARSVAASSPSRDARWVRQSVMLLRP